MSTIFIILPVYNRIAVTSLFIDSLLKQSYKNYFLLLVDDGSTDGTSEYVKSVLPQDKIRIIKGKGKWFWAGALQQGYNYLKNCEHKTTDYVLIINDDCIIENDFLEIGLNRITNSKEILLAEAYSLKDKEIKGSGIEINWRKLTFTITRDNERINCLSTRGLLMSVQAFLKIKGFHPLLIPHYLSDYEFTHRAYKKGYTLKVDPEYYLYYNEETTRNVNIEKKSFSQEIVDRFSKTSPNYIIAWLGFILLLCPARYKFKHLTKLFFFPLLRLLVLLKKKYIRAEKGFLG